MNLCSNSNNWVSHDFTSAKSWDIIHLNCDVIFHWLLYSFHKYTSAFDKQFWIEKLILLKKKFEFTTDYGPIFMWELEYGNHKTYNIICFLRTVVDNITQLLGVWSCRGRWLYCVMERRLGAYISIPVSFLIPIGIDLLTHTGFRLFNLIIRTCEMRLA